MENRVFTNTQIVRNFTLQLNEQEARALIAMACYGTKVFLENFEKGLGYALKNRHEDGVHSLFQLATNQLQSQIESLDQLRSLVRKNSKKI